MRKINILKDMYIKDTMNDGQKFCGCRREDCEDFDKKTKCKTCLDNFIAEKQSEMLNKAN